MKNRPDIPLPVLREVRKRCGFGCVICGLPLYEYDHILGWANVERHLAEEITLLCDLHHREKTGGLLPDATVRAANAAPFNLQEGVSKPYTLHYSGTECEAFIGGNSFTVSDAGYGTALVPVSIDGTPLLAFVLADGHLLLNVALFDEANELVLQIRNNEMVFRSDIWDVELVGRRLVLREAKRRILVELLFEVPNRIRVTRGRFLRNGVELLVQPDFALITNNGMLISDSHAQGCTGGIVIGPHDPPLAAAFGFPHVPRVPGDRSATIKWAKDSLGERSA